MFFEADPPFTPRSPSDSGEEDGATPGESRLRRTPPRPPTTPTSSSAARPGGASGRRRPRPPAADEGPDHRFQRQKTPRIGPPAPRGSGPLQEQPQSQRQQQQQQQQPQGGREEADRGMPVGVTGAAPEGEALEVVSVRAPGGAGRPRPRSAFLSPSPGCPSPPGIFSPSQDSQEQQEQQQQISLGQLSGVEDGGDEGIGGTIEETVLSAASVGGTSGDGGARDGFIAQDEAGSASSAEGGERRRRHRGGTDGREASQRRSGVAMDPLSSSRGRGGGDKVAREAATAGRPGAPGDDGDGGAGNGATGCGVGGGRRERTAAETSAAAAAPAAALGVDFGAEGKASRQGQGDAAGSSGRVSASPPAGAANGPALGGSAAPPIPTAADHGPGATAAGAGGQGRGEEPTTGEVVEVESVAIGHKPAAGPSASLWADLDGLSSGDDSGSDGGGGGAAVGGVLETSKESPPARGPRPPAAAESFPSGAAGRGTAHSQRVVGGEVVRGGLGHEELLSAPVSESTLEKAAVPRAAAAAEVAATAAEMAGGAGFSLFSGGVGNLGEDELLDAALEDSD